MDGHEGCNIFGWLDLQRLAGNFRISVRVEEFFQLTRVRTCCPAEAVCPLTYAEWHPDSSLCCCRHRRRSL